MDDIHAPTVASGPTSNGINSNGLYQDDLSLPELIAQKDQIESELKALGSVLDSHGVTMQTTLTTFDGYPRADLDIAQIRTTRSRIIPLKNDYKALMSRIELELHKQFASQPQDRARLGEESPQARPDTSLSSTQDHSSTDIPFAKVNTVQRGSPAESAGLRSGDRIITFADVNWTNHDKLARVAQTVHSHQGVSKLGMDPYVAKY
ncbi:MAG: hypothetical protein M1825_001892 [Sarcosagium campestre]|nr:MAG: hypothetical protein M1825_001892 [Sarcosagium campestre]